MSVDLSVYAAKGRGGMVAAARPEAANIGVSILKMGGNAFDAAVATALALGVCEPQCSGLGGGGFMTAFSKKAGKPVFIDFREIAPAYATPEAFGTGDLESAKKDLNFGGKSVGIPGELAGLCLILEKYGTMSLKEVMQPAIRLAREGFVFGPLLEKDLAHILHEFKRLEEPGDPYLRKEWKAEDVFTNPELADTMELIAEEGPDVFYRGSLAERIVASMNKHGAPWTLEDMASYKPNELEPVSGTYRGYDIYSSPLPSSGGTHVVQNLNICENFPLGDYPYDSPERLFYMAEAFKKTVSDRSKYTGDPKYVKVPVTGMTSKAYAKARAAEIRYGVSAEPACGAPFAYESGDTTHFSVADAEGNIVSITQTISRFFGADIVPENTGLVFNCQLRCFTAGAGHANSIAPGKKPLSSMSPSIMMKDGLPVAAFGSPGGDHIIGCVSQIAMNLVDFKMDMAQAVFAPRFFIGSSNRFDYETRFKEETANVLRSFGQSCKAVGSFERAMGGVNAIQFLPDGSLLGAADPRRMGGVSVVEPGEPLHYTDDADFTSGDCVV